MTVRAEDQEVQLAEALAQGDQRLVGGDVPDGDRPGGDGGRQVPPAVVDRDGVALVGVQRVSDLMSGGGVEQPDVATRVQKADDAAVATGCHLTPVGLLPAPLGDQDPHRTRAHIDELVPEVVVGGAHGDRHQAVVVDELARKEELLVVVRGQSRGQGTEHASPGDVPDPDRLRSEQVMAVRVLHEGEVPVVAQEPGRDAVRRAGDLQRRSGRSARRRPAVHVEAIVRGSVEGVDVACVRTGEPDPPG